MEGASNVKPFTFILLIRNQAFWDSTGGLWSSGKLAGKYGGIFVSTAAPGGGQESTAIASLSTFAHHGVLYVPFGYAYAFAKLTDLTEVHGGKLLLLLFRRVKESALNVFIGSPWGAGTFAGPDGSRQPSALELEIATIQGESFYNTIKKVSF